MVGIYVLPVYEEVPPVDVAYQFTTPALGVALNDIVPASQRLLGIVEFIVGMEFTVTVIDAVQVLVPFSTVQLYNVVAFGLTVIEDVLKLLVHKIVLPTGKSWVNVNVLVCPVQIGLTDAEIEHVWLLT